MSAGASDGSGCTRSRANAASLLAAPWLPAIAQPVGYRARRRASRKAWYLSTVACVAALCTAAAQAADQGDADLCSQQRRQLGINHRQRQQYHDCHHQLRRRSHRPFRSAATRRMSMWQAIPGSSRSRYRHECGNAVDRRKSWRRKTEEHGRYPRRPHHLRRI